MIETPNKKCPDYDKADDWTSQPTGDGWTRAFFFTKEGYDKAEAFNHSVNRLKGYKDVHQYQRAYSSAGSCGEKHILMKYQFI